MKRINSSYCEKRQVVSERRIALLIGALLGALWLSSAPVAMGQYGVRRTAVVRGPNTTVVASRTTVAGRGGTAVVRGPNTTVVARGGALPRGYIATLPAGYRQVYVSGVRYYRVGGVYYRPQIYGGRTTYVVVHL